MILTFGNCSAFGELHWFMLELRSEKTIEATLHRLGQAIPAIFCESAIEVFIPVAQRDLGLFELTTGTYIFVRSDNFQKLLRLKTITGVVGLATYGDSNHPSKAIKVENNFVQTQIEQAEQRFLNSATSIEVGSFVRIIDGEMRDWCGTVIEMHDGVAVVKVEIKTKIILVETPVRNLLDKSTVPENLRVFYYSELVEALKANGEEMLVVEDLKYEEDSAYTDDGLNAPPPKRHSRQQTVTALVKRMIVTGTHDPKVIGAAVLDALRAGNLKKPKNLSIVHGIIKNRLIEDYYQKLDPTITTYREVVEKFGEACRFSYQDLADLDPNHDLPRANEDKVEADPQPVR